MPVQLSDPVLQRIAPLVALLIAVGCEAERDQASAKVAEVSKQASDAADATKKFADGAVDTTKKAVDTTKKAVDTTKEATNKVVNTTKDATAKGKEMVDAAGKLWADIPYTGELSDTAKSWMADVRDSGAIESIIHEGTQIAPVALEIGKSVRDAIDSDTAIEPIFQKVSEGEKEELDEAIGDMPRTEVIDGLTIGFKQMDETTNAQMVKERGYLVTWRDGDRLYGFVYRSKRTIDVDKLVADAPKLLRLAKAAVADE